MANGIAVFLEFHGKQLTEQSAELLAFAVACQKPQQPIIALVADGQKAEASYLSSLPVTTLYAFPAESLPAAMADLAKPYLMDCSLCLTPMTVQGKEFAIFLSLALQWQLVLDGVGYQRTSDGYQITKATAAGQAQAIQKWPFDMPAVISMLPGKLGGILSFNGAAEVISLAAAETTSAKLEKVYFADWQEIGVDEADVVVAGGNGMQNQAQFQELAALGQLLSAPVGGSRVAEDKGWIPHEAMIGATGHTIGAACYLAFGISGAIQHLVGIQNCQRVIAINTDPMCAMMSNADLAVVGDAAEILPCLLDCLQGYERKKEG